LPVPSIIRKTAADLRVAPNLSDYDAQRRAFTWHEAARELAGLPGGGLNIAFEAVDRHAAGALRDRTAFRFLSADAPPHDMTYGELSRQSNRFANVLRTVSEWRRAIACSCCSGARRALLHFTSGTTGTPKGAMHVHGAVLTHWATGKLRARPASRRHLLVHRRSRLGHRHLVRHHRAAAARRDQRSSTRPTSTPSAGTASCRSRVSVWYTAPTAIRMLMKAGAELARQAPLPDLRFVASVGEPLNPEAVWWGQEVLGLPIHDNWWQTETGGIMIANTPALDIKPGSMGRRCPASRRRA
jgi:acyl-coenzyme A synthetase/AMP-(fatty) acid ligase